MGDAEFWLGLRNVYKLTAEGKHQLRVEMTRTNGEKVYAEYDNFHIADDSDNYRISFKASSYSGNAANLLEGHNNSQFSTKDADNAGNSCSENYGQGGNWFGVCYHQNLNGPYGTSYFYWASQLQKSRWMIREIV